MTKYCIHATRFSDDSPIVLFALAVVGESKDTNVLSMGE